MKKKEVITGYTAFVATVCLLTFALNMINGRFHLGDFRVYYTAAERLISGEPVYLVSFYEGSGFYKYSPATLLFFIPYNLFPFRVAAVLHFCLLSAAYWYFFILLRRIIRGYLVTGPLKREILLLSVSFLCIAIHLSRELYLGNINIILLLLCCLALQDFLSGRQIRGGILLAGAILTKPYLIVILLPLLWRRSWKAPAITLMGIAAGLMLPLIYPGPGRFAGLYRDWFETVLSHGEGFPGMTSISYLAEHYLPGWPSWGSWLIILPALLGVSCLILLNIKNERNPGLPGERERNLAFEWFLILGLLPNLIKTDWVLMLFTAPLITYMIFGIAAGRRYWFIPLLAVLLFFYGMNSDDLLGRELSRYILHSGLMGLSNFLLALVSLFMFYHSAHANKPRLLS